MREIVLDPLPGVDPAARDKIMVARALAVAAMDPTIRLDVNTVANAIGVVPEEARRLLAGDEYRSIVETEFRMRVTSAVTRGIQVMDDIVHDERSKPAEKALAMSQISKVFDTMTRLMTMKQKKDDSHLVTKAMDMLAVVAERLHAGTNGKPQHHGEGPTPAGENPPAAN